MLLKIGSRITIIAITYIASMCRLRLRRPSIGAGQAGIVDWFLKEQQVLTSVRPAESMIFVTALSGAQRSNAMTDSRKICCRPVRRTIYGHSALLVPIHITERYL